jgi:hypothetical protein
MPISEIAIDIWESLVNFLRIYGKPRKIKLSDFITPSINMLLGLAEIVTTQTSNAANFSIDDTEHRITVPKGERWMIYGGQMDGDVSGTYAITVCNKDNYQFACLLNASASTVPKYYPEIQSETTNMLSSMDLILKEGDYIKYKYGASQTAGALLNLRYLKLPFNPKDDYY